MSADETADGLRLDKWLWHARFCKTRALAAGLAGSAELEAPDADALAGELVEVGRFDHAAKGAGPAEAEAATPTAARAWRPTSSPRTAHTRSEAPLITLGWSPNSGVQLTKPLSLTTRATRSRVGTKTTGR